MCWLRNCLLPKSASHFGTEPAFLLERAQHGENQGRIQRVCEWGGDTHICFLIRTSEQRASEKT